MDVGVGVIVLVCTLPSELIGILLLNWNRYIIGRALINDKIVITLILFQIGKKFEIHHYI